MKYHLNVREKYPQYDCYFNKVLEQADVEYLYVIKV